MPRIVGDAVETLGTHGFRRTDQTSAEQAVMMHAMAASIDGLRTIIGISDSKGHACSTFVPGRKMLMFEVGCPHASARCRARRLCPRTS